MLLGCRIDLPKRKENASFCDLIFLGIPKSSKKCKQFLTFYRSVQKLLEILNYEVK